jgi:hypothetical protein
LSGTRNPSMKSWQKRWVSQGLNPSYDELRATALPVAREASVGWAKARVTAPCPPADSNKYLLSIILWKRVLVGTAPIAPCTCGYAQTGAPLPTLRYYYGPARRGRRQNSHSLSAKAPKAIFLLTLFLRYIYLILTTPREGRSAGHCVSVGWWRRLRARLVTLHSGGPGHRKQVYAVCENANCYAAGTMTGCL